MSLVEGSIRRPITVFMVTAAISIFGLVAQTRLAVDLLPDISYPSLTVRTNLPDAAPGDVEQFVTRPVEEGVGVVAGLVRMHSVSRPGQSEVTLEFQSGTRMDLASLSVREKLDLVTLPREAERPAILRFDPALDPVVRFRLSGGDNMRRLRRIAEQTVKRDLEGVAGVAAVRVSGGEEEEIQVEVDAARLSAAGLSLADVTQRLRDESINLAGGSLTEGRSEYLVRAVNQFADPSEISDVILAVRDNGMVRVSDVATVSRGARDREVVARVDGDESVEIGIYKEGDANTVQAATAVQNRAKAIALPRDLKLVAVADQSRFIRSAMSSVIEAALVGGLLAILVLYAFMRDLRTTLIVGLTIPVSVLATFVVMFRFGVSFNLMSLGGMALCIGNLVDNSIVVLESIFRKREEGQDARQAALSGTNMVARAVTASTLTTVAVFLPLVFVEGLAGQLIRDQALVISFSQVASLIVGLTLIPTIYAMLGKNEGKATLEVAPVAETVRAGRMAAIGRWIVFVVLALPRGIAWLLKKLGVWMRPWVNRLLIPFDAALAALNRVYPVVLRGALERPGRVLAWTTAAFAVSLVVGGMLPRNLFPPFTQGEFRFNVTLPPGTALHVTDDVLESLAERVRKDSRVKIVHTSVGQIDLAAFAGSAREANRGQISVVMKRADDQRAEEAVATVLRDAMDGIPGATYDYEVPSLFRFQTPIEVEVYAYDLDTLRTLADAVVVRMKEVRGLTDVESSTQIGDPEVQIAFDRARLAALHLDPLSASRLVRNAVQGEAATQFNDLERKIDVRVRATEDERSLVARLDELEVGRNQGMVVPLGAVADVKVARGPGDIRRIGQQRTAVVTANLEGRDLASAARDIEASLADMSLPPAARVSLAGQNRELSESFGSLRFALILAVFLVYLVMASQFESLLHPFVVMFSVPLAVIGVVVALGLTFTSISVMVLIGLVVLAGIAVNNAIVLVDYAREMRQQGMPKIEALVEAGTVRMRPILMTTLTTILGLLPMAFAIGEGAELSAPLAITLMGGLLGSTILTLIVIPVVYASIDRSR
jgi:hydrophobic/amphiphilic exporter-1 (mainly G- bacteria), HAE1 family